MSGNQANIWSRLVENLWKKITAYEKHLRKLVSQVDDEDRLAIEDSFLMVAAHPPGTPEVPS